MASHLESSEPANKRRRLDDNFEEVQRNEVQKHNNHAEYSSQMPGTYNRFNSADAPPTRVVEQRPYARTPLRHGQYLGAHDERPGSGRTSTGANALLNPKSADSSSDPATDSDGTNNKGEAKQNNDRTTEISTLSPTRFRSQRPSVEDIECISRSPSTPSRICNCNDPDSKVEQREVPCANPACKIGRYHAVCVGLATRPPSSTWKCRDCRVPPPPTSTTVFDLATLKPEPGPTEPPLSAQQAAVVDLIVHSTRNVCYTGSAGTGKSTVLKAVVRALRDQGKTVDIVAPSGIAALAVGGQTVFSYAGWVPDTFKMSLQKIGQRAHGKKIRRRLCKTDVLIIEEISMVDSHVFQRLERSCREARDTAFWDQQIPETGFRKHNANLPFGGMQVVVTGDFCQLPPVKPFRFCLHCGGDELPGWQGNRGSPITCLRCNRSFEDAEKWAFRNDAWDQCNFAYVELTEIHRQIDPVFTNILQKCRTSIPLSRDDKFTLLHHPSHTKDAVHLRPTIAEVLTINGAAFRVLPGPSLSYECWDMFDWRKNEHPELANRGDRRTDGRYEGRDDGPLKALQDHRFEERVQLKLNTLVILLVNLNIDIGLVNGAQGKVIGFHPYSKDGGPDPASVPSSFLPETVGEYKELRAQQVQTFANFRKVEAWPIVRFNNGVSKVIYPTCQLSEFGLSKPYSLMGRTQLPLIQAWAITVHKSQGMTLSCVEVDLSRAFEKEMIYVALSRCKTLEGLKVHALPREMDYGPNLVVQEFLKRFQPAGNEKKRPERTAVSTFNAGHSKNPTMLD